MSILVFDFDATRTSNSVSAGDPGRLSSCVTNLERLRLYLRPRAKVRGVTQRDGKRLGSAPAVLLEDAVSQVHRPGSLHRRVQIVRAQARSECERPNPNHFRQGIAGDS
jgi:hypothetical protein